MTVKKLIHYPSLLTYCWCGTYEKPGVDVDSVVTEHAGLHFFDGRPCVDHKVDMTGYGEHAPW